MTWGVPPEKVQVSTPDHHSQPRGWPRDESTRGAGVIVKKLAPNKWKVEIYTGKDASGK